MPKTTKGKDRLELAVKEYIKGVYIVRDNSYTWTQALKDAGYSEKYANKQCSTLRKQAKGMIQAEKDKLFEEQKYNLNDWEHNLKDLYQRCREKGDFTNEKACIDMGLKLNGGYVQITKDITESSPLSTAEEHEISKTARELNIKLSKQRLTGS